MRAAFARWRATLVSVPLWVWLLTIAVIVGLLAFDFFFHVRKAHIPTIKEAAVWSAIYVGIAVVFGIGLWVLSPGHTATSPRRL